MRLVSFVVSCAFGCAPALRPAPPPSDSPAVAAQMADMQKMMLESQAAQEGARRACEPLSTRAPGFAEERAVGTELAVTFAAQRGHFYLDGATETDPRKLEEDLRARKLVVLPEGKKNAVSAHVALVGRNLARYSARPELPWVFGVIENDAADSFSAPGGYVFVTTGLLKKLTNEAQLAGVLGHEISHVVKKDLLKKYVDARYKQCIAARYAAAMIAHSGSTSPAVAELARYAKNFDNFDLDQADGGFVKFILDAFLMMSMMGSDKAEEFAHDKAALELVSFAGYDPIEYEKFLASNPMPKHPDAGERAKLLQIEREGALKDVAIGTAKPDLTKLLAPLHP